MPVSRSHSEPLFERWAESRVAPVARQSSGAQAQEAHDWLPFCARILDSYAAHPCCEQPGLPYVAITLRVMSPKRLSIRQRQRIQNVTRCCKGYL